MFGFLGNVCYRSKRERGGAGCLSAPVFEPV
jgi:hypothetical protein